MTPTFVRSARLAAGLILAVVCVAGLVGCTNQPSADDPCPGPSSSRQTTHPRFGHPRFGPEDIQIPSGERPPPNASQFELAALEALEHDPRRKSATYIRGVLTVTIYLNCGDALPQESIDEYAALVRAATGAPDIVIEQDDGPGLILQ